MGNRRVPSPPPSAPDYAGPPQRKPAPPAAPPAKHGIATVKRVTGECYLYSDVGAMRCPLCDVVVPKSTPHRCQKNETRVVTALCSYCGLTVAVENGRAIPHHDMYPTRACEGGNRRVVGGRVPTGARR